MKKHLLTGLVSVSLMLTGSALFANGTPAPKAAPEGLEISGNVDVVAGYQHDDKDAVGSSMGGMGDVSFGTGANFDQFRFIVDQVEIDLAKSFGENIRLRADIDFTNFGDTNNQPGADVVNLEQGYVTANIPAGNGLEFLIGKFNAPVGIESADRNQNWLVSYSPTYRYLLPTNVTGAKIYYAFSDLVDWHLAVVNDLNANGFGDSAIPSIITTLGFNWGEEGNKNTVSVSGGFGPEHDSSAGDFTTDHNAHIDFYGDLDFILALTDTLNLAGEGTYRQTDQIAGGANQKAFGAQLLLNYEASDLWDVTFRYAYEWDVNGGPAGPRFGGGASTTGGNWNGAFEGNIHSGTVGASYKIADGAKMKMEYRFDFAAVAGPANNSDYHSLMAEFAYDF